MCGQSADITNVSQLVFARGSGRLGQQIVKIIDALDGARENGSGRDRVDADLLEPQLDDGVGLVHAAGPWAIIASSSVGIAQALTRFSTELIMK